MPLLLSSLPDNTLLFFFSLFLPSISRYCPKCQRKSDTSACCVSQIDQTGAGAEKTALVAGPISTPLRLLGCMGRSRGGGGGRCWLVFGKRTGGGRAMIYRAGHRFRSIFHSGGTSPQIRFLSRGTCFKGVCAAPPIADRCLRPQPNFTPCIFSLGSS